MTTVDFITFCCPKDIERLSQPMELYNRRQSHGYRFDNVFVVAQRCKQIIINDTTKYSRLWEHVDYVVHSEDFSSILKDYHIQESVKADEMTHGPDAPHYWKWHVINHLIGLSVSSADYIVFSDCDCRMLPSFNTMSWIEQGVRLLESYKEILLVAPSDGGHDHLHLIQTQYGNARVVQTVSQQLFLCDRVRLKEINFDVPWDWEFTAPGGPMQEFYYMLEGRMWRYMHHNKMYRVILPETWRYWHDGWH